jgi:hypothetical protein
MANYSGAGFGGNFRGSIGRAIIDDQNLGIAKLCRKRLQQWADIFRLVFGGQDDADGI